MSVSTQSSHRWVRPGSQSTPQEFYKEPHMRALLPPKSLGRNWGRVGHGRGMARHTQRKELLARVEEGCSCLPSPEVGGGDVVPGSGLYLDTRALKHRTNVSQNCSGTYFLCS